jgi:hypothetical protein
MDTYSRNCIFDCLSKYCIGADSSDYIELTEWHNGEGLDINIYRKNGGESHYSLSDEELDAIIHLRNTLRYK